MALPKANRLRRRQDFSAVYRNGIRRKSAHLTLVAMRQTQPRNVGSQAANISPSAPSMTMCPPRVGISISQKVSKRSVVRNRIKRQIRAAMLQLLPHMLAGWNLVIVVQPQAIECDYFQFLQELEQLLINAEVLNGHS